MALNLLVDLGELAMWRRAGHVTKWLGDGTNITFPDGDQELDLSSASGRLHLMANLSEGRVSLQSKEERVKF